MFVSTGSTEDLDSRRFGVGVADVDLFVEAMPAMPKLWVPLRFACDWSGERCGVLVRGDLSLESSELGLFRRAAEYIDFLGDREDG